MRTVPRLCECNPGICLTTEEKARKNLSQGSLGKSWCLCDRASPVQYNDVNNQQDATLFSFINLFKSAQHVSGDKFVHPQEHFLTVYTAFGTLHRLCCRPVVRFRWNISSNSTCATGRQQRRCIVPKAVYIVKKCSWGWANLSPEICWADLKRLIKEKVVVYCWLFTSLVSLLA